MIGCLPLMPCAAPTLDPCRCRGMKQVKPWWKKCHFYSPNIMRSGFLQLEFLCVGFSSTWSSAFQSDVLAGSCWRWVGSRNVRYDWSSCGDFFAGVNCEIACRTPYEGWLLLVGSCLNSQVILLGNWIDRKFYANCLGHFFLGRGPKRYYL